MVGTPSGSDGSQVPPPADHRLDSWKEIAAYLKRAVRTVRRWERSERLPVHRHVHEKRGSVYAYPTELDAWRASRGAGLEQGGRDRPGLGKLPWRRAGLRALLGAAIVTALAVGLVTARRLRRVSSQPERVILTQLTFDLGASAFPVISRDGKVLAYASDRAGGEFDIWVQPLTGGGPSRVTRHEARDRHPDISPDGASIAFRSERDGGGIYIVSLLGGQERKIADRGYSPRFSPDGQWIVYTVGTTIQILPASGGSPRIVEPEFAEVAPPIWTPDGKHVLFCAAREPAATVSDRYDWWVAPAAGGRAARTGVSDALRRGGLPPAGPSVVPGDWIGNSVVFSLLTGDSANIWEIPLSPASWQPVGPARRLTFGPGSHTYPRVAGGGGRPLRLVFNSEDIRTQIWSLPIQANEGKPIGDLVPLTGDLSLHPNSVTHQRLSADGTKLVFCSRSSGNADIWVKDIESGREIRLTATAGAERQSLIRADGLKVAYLVQEDEKPTGYIVDASGGAPEKICESCSKLLDWSPDGTRILYASEPSRSIRVLHLSTRATAELARSEQFLLHHATFSPCGQWIALYATERSGSGWRGWFLAPAWQGAIGDAKEWIKAVGLRPHDEPSPVQWSPDGNLLYFLTTRDAFRCIWAQRLHGASKQPVGEAFPVHHFHGAQRLPWGYASISVGTDKLTIPLAVGNTNIWMAELGAELSLGQ